MPQPLRILSRNLTKLLGVGALALISAAPLMAVISAPGRFRNHGSDSEENQFKASQELNIGL